MRDSIPRLRTFSGLRILPFSRGDPGCHGFTSPFSISDVEPRMFGETTRPSNEQTRPYTARIREWEISLSRPSPVARRRLRHSLYVRIVCRTSPCNVYTEYRYSVRQLRPDLLQALEVYCWFLGVAARTRAIFRYPASAGRSYANPQYYLGKTTFRWI